MFLLLPHLVDILHGVWWRLPLLEQHLSSVLSAGLCWVSLHHLRPGPHWERWPEMLSRHPSACF